MADTTDPMKLSSFVNSIVDRKIKAIATSLINISKTLRDQYTQLTKLKTFQNRFARGCNAYGSWELRPGIIEMWGNYVGTADREALINFTFPLILPNVQYHLDANPIVLTPGFSKDLWVQIVHGARTVSSSQIYYQSSTSDPSQKLDGFSWRVICQVAFDYIAPEVTSVPAAGTGDSSFTTGISIANSRANT